MAYGPEPTPTKQNARAGQLYQTFRKYFEGNGVKDFSWENNIEPALRDMLGLIDAASERKTGASDKKLSPASLVVALRPRLGLKPMVISVSNHGRRVVKSDTPSSTPCVWAVTLCIVCQGVRGDEARRARCSEEEHRGVGGERRPLRPSECAL